MTLRWGSLLALKAAAGAWALHLGFTHVSDDDYARVVIAEQFAHLPSLDPSGTSWLPLPFWLHGTSMLLAGRSLGVAMGLAWLLGLASILVGYFALRGAGVPPTPSWIAALLVGTSPWNTWLGVATVPESWTAALVFFGAMTLVEPLGRRAPGGRRLLGAAALLAASLSRYEAWPVAGVFAGVCVFDALRGAREARARLVIAMGLALLGPCLWMAWNAHAHGSWLHFVARVSAFHKTHSPSAPVAEQALAYPRALFAGAPELVIVGALGLLGRRAVLARWALPLASVGALLGFLVYGDLHDGAPTHHAERALLVVWWVLAGFGVDGTYAWFLRHAWARPKREAWAVALGVATGVALAGEWANRVRDYPGKAEEEDRVPQVERGLALRRDEVAHVTVVPCEYEHFALLAAWGAPENAEVLPATHARVTRGCPDVERP